MTKKKRFDKKGAYRFSLLHRSQQDALFASGAASGDVAQKMVLHPADTKTAKAMGRPDSVLKGALFTNYVASGENKKGTTFVDDEEEYNGGEQEGRRTRTTRKELREVDEFGFPLDGYDYSQHLSEMGGGIFIDALGNIDESGAHLPVTVAKEAGVKARFANEAIVSEVEMPMLLEAITLRPERMDKDMLAALELIDTIEEEEEGGETEAGASAGGAFEELNDDFFQQLVVLEKEAEKSKDPKEKDAFDFEAHMRRLMIEAEKEDREDGNEEEEDEEINVETMVGTEQTLDRREIDDHFETVLEEYDDEEIGALDDVEYDETVGGELLNDNDRVLLELKAHIKKEKIEKEQENFFNSQTFRAQKSQGVTLDDINEDLKAETAAEIEQEEDDTNEKSEELKPETMMGPYTIKPKPNWDCETIVSTYSRTDNHPSKIRVDGPERRRREKKSVDLGENIAIAATSSDEDDLKEEKEEDLKDEKDQEEKSLDDDDDEDDAQFKEEKKLRKKAVKAERRARREEKKANKILFAKTHQKQIALRDAIKHGTGLAPGLSVMKLS